MYDTNNLPNVLWISPNGEMVAEGIIIQIHHDEKKVLLKWELQDPRRDMKNGPLQTWVEMKDVHVQTTVPLAEYLDSKNS